VKVLVTGGAGYIGSHTCKALHAAGHHPVTYDNLSHGHAEAVQWGPLEQGDILDTVKLVDSMKQHAIEGVIHFAGLIAVGESVREPERYHRVNVQGTQSLIDAMKQAAVSPIVFSSSAAVYGTPDAVPIAEDAAKHPISPYGENKLACEQLLMESGLSTAALRYFNAAGADPDAQIGECHDPETHLIPLVLDAAAGRRPNITVYGEDYPTPDGTCIRDYIHVTDLAQAHVIALSKLAAGSGNFAVNLGTGRGISVREIIDAARAITGREIPIIMGERRAGDPAQLVSDIRRSNEVLGWTPTRSDLATIITDAWRWHCAKA
jgi:UDP-glucose-4-epimerase GalE